MTSAREMIKKAYGSSKNFMTPNVISYGKIGKDVAYELSSGSGIFTPMLYGVSVVKENPYGGYEKLTNISQSFTSLQEAKAYIEKLKREGV